MIRASTPSLPAIRLSSIRGVHPMSWRNRRPRTINLSCRLIKPKRQAGRRKREPKRQAERRTREKEENTRGLPDLRDIRDDVLLLPFAASVRCIEQRGNPPPPGFLSRHGCNSVSWTLAVAACCQWRLKLASCEPQEESLPAARALWSLNPRLLTAHAF
jgi:hypothetical protein